MGLQTVDELKVWLEELLGEKENITAEDIAKYSPIAIQARNIMNCPVRVNEEQITEIYKESFDIK